MACSDEAVLAKIIEFNLDQKVLLKLEQLEALQQSESLSMKATRISIFQGIVYSDVVCTVHTHLSGLSEAHGRIFLLLQS